MTLTQKHTDFAAIAVGVLSTIALLYPIGFGLALGYGFSVWSVLLVLLIGFCWYTSTKSWRNDQMRQVPGVTAQTPLNKLYLIAGISGVIWLLLVGYTVLTGSPLLVVIATLVVVATLREIGFRLVRPTNHW